MSFESISPGICVSNNSRLVIATRRQVRTSVHYLTHQPVFAVRIRLTVIVEQDAVVLLTLVPSIYLKTNVQRPSLWEHIGDIEVM